MNSNSYKITGITHRQVSDSRTDGIGATQLSFPIMGFHIYFPSFNHSEMASDTDNFARLFLTDYCKALSFAVSIDDNPHLLMNIKALRAKGGLNSTPSDYLQKNRVFISNKKKYPVVEQHRELAFSQPLELSSMTQR